MIDLSIGEVMAPPENRNYIILDSDRLLDVENQLLSIFYIMKLHHELKFNHTFIFSHFLIRDGN